MSRFNPREMTIEQLKNIIWKIAGCGLTVSPYSVEVFRDELERRTGERKGYHNA